MAIYDVENRTTDDLNNLKEMYGKQLPIEEAKLHMYGRMLGETDAISICNLLEAMYNDAKEYEYALEQYNCACTELERRKSEGQDV